MRPAWVMSFGGSPPAFFELLHLHAVQIFARLVLRHKIGRSAPPAVRVAMGLVVRLTYGFFCADGGSSPFSRRYIAAAP